MNYGAGVSENFDMAQPVKIVPPIFVRSASGVTFTLGSVEAVIDFVRLNEPGSAWQRLREAAFIAVAVPSAENIEVLRVLAGEAFAKASDPS
jgi:hypothetical protein